MFCVILLYFCKNGERLFWTKLSHHANTFNTSVKFYEFCRYRIGIMLLQSSAIITRSNITRYGTQHNSDWSRTYTKSHHSQKTPHISPSRVSYGVSIVRIWEKIDHIIMALHCISFSILLSCDFKIKLFPCVRKYGYLCHGEDEYQCTVPVSSIETLFNSLRPSDAYMHQ